MSLRSVIRLAHLSDTHLAGEPDTLPFGQDAAATLAARRSADGWIDWRPAPAPAIGRRVLRLAAGSPAPSAERIGALLDAATSGRGGRTIELGGERRALLRGGRVQIVHSA